MANYIIYTDGGARGNPGNAGVGVVVQDAEGVVISEISKALGVATNNEAEYQAVILALEQLPDLIMGETKGVKIELKIDSQLIARQIQKKYKIKEPRLKVLCEAVWFLINDLGIDLSITEIPREENKEADRLANQAMDSFA